MREAIEDIDSEIEQLNFKKDALLRKAGWRYTSSTPGCLWIWTKQVEGYGLIMVNRESAIYIEDSIQEFARPEVSSEDT